MSSSLVSSMWRKTPCSSGWRSSTDMMNSIRQRKIKICSGTQSAGETDHEVLKYLDHRPRSSGSCVGGGPTPARFPNGLTNCWRSMELNSNAEASPAANPGTPSRGTDSTFRFVSGTASRGFSHGPPEDATGVGSGAWSLGAPFVLGSLYGAGGEGREGRTWGSDWGRVVEVKDTPIAGVEKSGITVYLVTSSLSDGRALPTRRIWVPKVHDEVHQCRVVESGVTSHGEIGIWESLR